MTPANIKTDFRVVFMGTPEFAVHSLDFLIRGGINVVAVVSVPDKPAGRRLRLKTSAVKDYALSKNLPLLQPENLSDNIFLEALSSYNADLNVVVAFRILPRVVYAMPAAGTINLHASLLPQYRGAAPINHAIINGETSSGLTTFLLDDKVDTGNILLQKTLDIAPDETYGELHDRMKECGADLLLKTINLLKDNEISGEPQHSRISPDIELKKAPRIFREDCRINWKKNALSIYNLIRGLSPYPCAFTELKDVHGKTINIKILKADYSNEGNTIPGKIYSDGSTLFGIGASDGIVFFKEIKPEGKNTMSIEAFLRGNKTIAFT